MIRCYFILFALMGVLCQLYNEAFAQWSNDPTVNTPICTAATDQKSPTIVSDGSGGAIITWTDGRSYIGGNADIYAQRINSAGVVQWTANGVAISTAASVQVVSAIISDGAGGAIITWNDYRSGNADIYAQRINSAGVVQWTADGVAISTAANRQFSTTITSDGAGGAIITWNDYRSGNADIYAQRINSAGVVQWTTDGVSISTAANNQESPTIVTDGAGGAIITWEDYRSGSNWDIYAQRINSAGEVLWEDNGVTISTEANEQVVPTIVSDGSGGAIITWHDVRSGNADIYAQRINSAGVVQWTANGVAISTEASGQVYPAIISDGAGGAIITWIDGRSNRRDIYGQRINNAGVVQWTADGVPISTAANYQFSTTITSDGAGGAIITWDDFRSGGTLDIYAQRINSAGVVQWTANGVAISTAADRQRYTTLTSDGAGGAIITWRDERSGNRDIYAQNVNGDGTLGNPLPSISVVTPNGGETFYKGARYTIQWTSTNYSGRVQIFLYKGSSKVQDISYSEPPIGTFSFTPDCGLVSGVDYKIRVAATGPGNQNDFSDAPFTITNQSTNDPCCNPADKFRLKFPLAGWTPYTDSVSAIFDHSMTFPYDLGGPRDKRIISFANDTASWTDNPSPCDRTSYLNPLVPRFNDPSRSNLARFIVYRGSRACNPRYLSYDGHPGYDYVAEERTPIFAAESGTVHYPSVIPYGGPSTWLREAWRYHTLEIQHDDPHYKTLYLHVLTYPERPSENPCTLTILPPIVNEGARVCRGDLIARVGNFYAPRIGSCNISPHLHFEVLYNSDPSNPNSWYPVDPYGWKGEQGSNDPYLHANSPVGNITLWKVMTNPQRVTATLVQLGSASYTKKIYTKNNATEIKLEWVFAADSISYFEIDRYGSDASISTMTTPATNSTYYQYVDSGVAQVITYTYYIRAAFLDGTFSGSSSPAVIYSTPSSNSTQTLYAFQNHTVPFSIDSSGLYQLSLTQPSQLVKYLHSKTGFTSIVDSVGFFLQWGLIDPSGKRIDRESPSVGSITYTDTSQSFAVSVSENETGIWNLILSGTENIPIGDSLIVTMQVDTTTQAVYTVDKQLVSFYGVPIGDSLSDSVTITNIGNLPLALFWSYSGSSRFHVTNDSSVISPAGHVNIPIVFLSLDSTLVTGEIVVLHNGVTSPDTIQLTGVGGPEVLRQFAFRSKWNLISLPLQVENSLKQDLFPTAISNAYRYDPNVGYLSIDTLESGVGYWLKFPVAESLSIIGIPVSAETIDVVQAWNLIGSISVPVAVTSISSIPPGIVTSDFFGYSGVYYVTNTIYPGKGYWVKSNQAGSIILSTSPPSSQENLIKIVSTSELPPTPPSEKFADTGIPENYALEQAYPNPFNPSTIIRYQLPIASTVTLKIIDLLGREVETLVDEVQERGYKTVEWNSKDNSGNSVASGVYFYRLEAIPQSGMNDPRHSFVETKKLLLLR